MIEKNRSLRQLETRKREEKYGDRKKRQKREEAGNREVRKDTMNEGGHGK